MAASADDWHLTSSSRSFCVLNTEKNLLKNVLLFIDWRSKTQAEAQVLRRHFQLLSKTFNSSTHSVEGGWMLCWSGIPFPTRFSHLGSYFACCPLSESWNGHGQPHYFYFGSILVNPHFLMVVLIYASNGSNGCSVANYVCFALETLKLIYYSVPIARNVEQRFDWRKIANRQNGCNAQKDKRPWFRIDVYHILSI